MNAQCHSFSFRSDLISICYQVSVVWVSDECNRVEIPYKKIKPDRIMCGPAVVSGVYP